MDKVTPCLWFDGQAEEAARFYTSLIPNSRIVDVQRSPSDTPSDDHARVPSRMTALASRLRITGMISS